MSYEIRDPYLGWLYSLIGTPSKNPARSYRILAKHLHDVEFTWSVPHDENRAADGFNLREEYGRALRAPRKTTLLEMMISLARLGAFESGTTEYEWFHIMLDNCGLSQLTDANFDYLLFLDIVHRVLSRTYDHNGRGGFFPLDNAETNQRNVELWYQMSAYLLENHLY